VEYAYRCAPGLSSAPAHLEVSPRSSEFFIGGAALRLLMGPISLGPFASIIEDALNHRVAGVVSASTSGVEWSRAEGKVQFD